MIVGGNHLDGMQDVSHLPQRLGDQWLSLQPSVADPALGGQLQGKLPRDGISAAARHTLGTTVHWVAGLDGLRGDG